MLTLFSVPKPFVGHIGDIQRNAIASWSALDPAIQVVLIGDDEGVEDAAREMGVQHVGGLERSPRGTPRLDSAFACADAVARHELRCFVNADILFLDDFLPAIRRVQRRFERFLVVGESRDLGLEPAAPIAEQAFRNVLRRRALEHGRLRGYAALDWFIFPRGHFGGMPPFLIGRACYDNWLVWKARQAGPVVDATSAVVAVHQSHGYGHVAGGKEEAYYGEEAKQNERLAGGRSHIYTLYDASHRLPRRGPIYPYWGSVLRAREALRAGGVKLQVVLEERRARASRVRPLRVVAVLDAPSVGSTGVLEELGRRDSFEVSVLYERAADGAPRPEHDNWIMRSVDVHGHRVNPAIIRALIRLHPDVVLVGDGTGLSGRVASAWCRLRRVPCLPVSGAEDGAVLADAAAAAVGRAG